MSPYRFWKGVNRSLNRTAKNFGIYIAIFAVVLAVAWFYVGNTHEKAPTELVLSELVDKLIDEQVAEIKVVGYDISGKLVSGEEFICYSPGPY